MRTLLLAVLCPLPAGEMLPGDLENADTVSWRLVGGSPQTRPRRWRPPR